MSDIEYGRLGERDLFGPYFPNDQWQQRTGRDLWIPTTDDRQKRIVNVSPNSMTPDRIPMDDKPQIASCVDALLIDHDQPGEFRILERIARILEEARRQRAEYEEQWLSQTAHNEMDEATAVYVQRIKTAAETDLRHQEQLFNGLILAHGGLYMIAQSDNLRENPETEAKRRAYFAAPLCAVALRLSFTDESAEFAFEAIVTSRQSGERGLLPEEGLSITGVFVEHDE